MSTSELLIVTPGLVTAEAAFYYETPTLFLPASNNSQYVQLDKYRKLGLGNASVHLADYMKQLDLDDVSPHESIKQVMDQLTTFADSSELKEKVGKRINTLVKSRSKWSEESSENGKRFIESIGGNGIHKAVSLIERVIT